MDGAKLLVECLEAHGVEYVFVVPGASIDPILNVLVDQGPEIVLCRHEQNAAFMAQAWGRITGKPGVCMATAGPGLTNLVTGIATADAERCPVVAITGQVARTMQFKRAHQNVDSVNLFAPITKWSIEVNEVSTIPDIVANAFQTASEPREGPTHISIPVDVLKTETQATVLQVPERYTLGVSDCKMAKTLWQQAKRPVVFLGIAASKPHVVEGVRGFLKENVVPIVGTFEAGGAVPRELVDRFMGRLGVFRNQPGDRVLKEADVVLAVGYDLVEYDPAIWNKGLERSIIHVDEVSSTLDQAYLPTCELIGDIGANLRELGRTENLWGTEANQELMERQEKGGTLSGSPVHPLRLIYEIRKLIGDEVTVISDVGSHQYWMARNFFCYRPQHFLTSMGFQTMGISLGWAIATTLARPGQKVLSVSGDGSFLMCSMELETAVRLQSPIVHLVWEDGAFDLVKIQQELKYGRDSAARFGRIDTVKYAESLGAKGLRIGHSDEIVSVLEEAMAAKGPVVISVPIDYRDNREIVDVQVEI